MTEMGVKKKRSGVWVSLEGWGVLTLGQALWKDDSWSSSLVQMQQGPPAPTCWKEPLAGLALQ